MVLYYLDEREHLLQRPHDGACIVSTHSNAVLLPRLIELRIASQIFP